MKLILVLVFSLIQFVNFSQEVRLHFKKLSSDELNLKIYEPYPNAPAVILYDIGEMYFDINPTGNNLFLFQKRHVRIKILNEEGLKYAKMTFVYNDMNCEQLDGELSYDIRAFTHNINDKGELISTRLKNKNIVFRDSLNCLKIADVSFPEVSVGSIIEYILVIPTLKLIQPDTWYFEKEIPVIYSEFNAYIPDEFKYIFTLRNVPDIKQIDSSYYNKMLDYKFKSGNYLISSNINISGKRFKFVNTNLPMMESKMDAQRLKIRLKHAIAKPNDRAWERLSRAIMITTYDDYDSRTPGQRKLLPYPASYYVYYMPSWPQLFEKLQNSARFGQALVKFWDCDSILQSITKDKVSEKDKAESIYQLVKKNMKWNHQYSIYADVSDNLLKTLYGKTGAKVKFNSIGNYFALGEGNTAEINFILIFLLNKAKIKVSPVLVNLTSNEPVERTISDVKQFISVIALVEINGDKILLDAAEPESSFNNLSEKYDLNQMLIVNHDNFEWLKPI